MRPSPRPEVKQKLLRTMEANLGLPNTPPPLACTKEVVVTNSCTVRNLYVNFKISVFAVTYAAKRRQSENVLGNPIKKVVNNALKQKPQNMVSNR